MALGSPTAVRSPYQQPTLDPPMIAAWMRRAADLIEQHGYGARGRTTIPGALADTAPDAAKVEHYHGRDGRMNVGGHTLYTSLALYPLAEHLGSERGEWDGAMRSELPMALDDWVMGGDDPTGAAVDVLRECAEKLEVS